MTTLDLCTHVDAGRNLSILYRPHSADEYVLHHSFDRDIFLPEIPEYRPQQGDVVIDIGAHIGTFSCLVARTAPGARIFAIEACLETFEILNKNIMQNGLTNVSAIHLLLLDRTGSARLYHDLVTGNWGHSAVTPLSSEFETVNCDSMENLIERENLESVDLIRMNCEGAEFPIILATPLAVLQRVKNMLVLHHAYLSNEFRTESLVNHLRKAGFRVRITNRRTGEGWIVASRVGPTMGGYLRYLRYKVGRRVEAFTGRSFGSYFRSVGV